MSELHNLNTPIFWAEGHPGKLDRKNWQVEISGLCSKPQIFTWKDLQKFPKITVNARLTSVTRWSVYGSWGGIKLSEILKNVGAKFSVKYLRFWSVGKHYDTSIPLSVAQKERTLLAYEFNGEFLNADYGGPIRIFCPYLWGYKSAKSVVKIELLDHYIPGFWEKRGYTDSGKIEAGIVRDLNQNGKIRPIPAGEVKDFLDE
ncbi:MAG: molybdopterin-dependent oxidoreductase [Candidatus Cloacimonadota bacterium]|nr:molybdopterin-dependent oxidoreductase [Candidatus Cloacimonadota bacterium]